MVVRMTTNYNCVLRVVIMDFKIADHRGGGGDPHQKMASELDQG